MASFADEFRRRLGTGVDEKKRRSMRDLMAASIQPADPSFSETNDIDSAAPQGSDPSATRPRRVFGDAPRGMEAQRDPVQSPISGTSFRDMFASRMRGTPGFAGGTLEEQLGRASQQGGDVNAGNRQPLTPQQSNGGFADRLMNRPRIADPSTPASLGSSLIFNKRQGGFDSYDINKREGETPEEAMRRIDLGDDMMSRPNPDRGEYLTSEPLGQSPTRPRRMFSDASTPAPGATANSLRQWLTQNGGSSATGDGKAEPADVLRPPRSEMSIAPNAEGKAAGTGFSFRDALSRSSPTATRDTGSTVNGEMSNEPFGASGEPFRTTRERRTQPRDYLADDEQYLRDLENQRYGIKDKIVDSIRALSTNFNGSTASPPTKRERDIARAQATLGRDLAIDKGRAQSESDRAVAYERRGKPPAGSTRIVDEGEYPGIPAGTEIRQRWDANAQDYVDDLGSNGNPRVSKSARAERDASKEIKYNNQGHAMLVPKDGGPATPIFQEDGTPLTKQANESGNVQTAYRLASDGITQIQIERDDQTGEWVDSIGRDKKPVVRGRVGRIDPTSGAPTSTLITDERVTKKEREENERKRRSYQSEAQEWSSKESAFRNNKKAEDEAIRTKTAQLQALYQEEPAGTILNRSGRDKTQIETDRARLQKEIETHRENAKGFQTEADKAAGMATEARRNAGLYTTGTQQGANGVIGRAAARDGKHHYTKAEIRDQAEASGVRYEDLYRTLKSNKNVVIDE